MRVTIRLVAYRLCFAQIVERLENGLVLKRNHKNQKSSVSVDHST